MDRYDIMMPRLFPAEASKPGLYKGLLVTAGIILTCYGLLTAGSILLPILRERIEINRAGKVIAFRYRINVHSKPTVMIKTLQSTLTPTVPVSTVETVPPATSKKVVTSRLNDVPTGNPSSSKFQSPCSSISPLAVP